MWTGEWWCVPCPHHSNLATMCILNQKSNAFTKVHVQKVAFTLIKTKHSH